MTDKPRETKADAYPAIANKVVYAYVMGYTSAKALDLCHFLKKLEVI